MSQTPRTARYALGARVEKINTVPGSDAHHDGALATVAEVMGPTTDGTYGYMVVWDDLPGVKVFIAGSRLRPVNTAEAVH